jgi:hypothetical protein
MKARDDDAYSVNLGARIGQGKKKIDLEMRGCVSTNPLE